MLLFLFIAFNLGLLALAAGVALLIWSLRTKEIGSPLAKAAGAIVSVLALFGVIYLTFNIVSAMTEKPMMPPPGSGPMHPGMERPGMEKPGMQGHGQTPGQGPGMQKPPKQ